MLFREIEYPTPLIFHFPLNEWYLCVAMYLFRRSHGFPIYLGRLSTVSHAFYTNFAHNIDIVDSGSGAMEIHCDKVSMNIVKFSRHFIYILQVIHAMRYMMAFWMWIFAKILFSELRFISRYPHGKLASLVLSHCGSAILLSFLLSPILCLPTYFLFGITEAHIVNDQNVNVHIYHVNVNEDTALYRWVGLAWDLNTSQWYFLFKQYSNLIEFSK